MLNLNLTLEFQILILGKEEKLNVQNKVCSEFNFIKIGHVSPGEHSWLSTFAL